MAVHYLNSRNAHTTYHIYDDVIIDDIGIVCHRLEPNKSDHEGLLDSVSEFIRDNTEVFYFTADLEPCTRAGSVLLWMFTGMLDSRGNPLFLSLLKARHRDIFSGHFVGTIDALAEVQTSYTMIPDALKHNIAEFGKSFTQHLEELKEQYEFSNLALPRSLTSPVPKLKDTTSIKVDSTTLPNNNADIDEYIPSASTNFFDIVHSISDMLLINNWELENGSPYNGLIRFLNHLSTRIKSLVESQTGDDYYILNDEKDAIINSGLIDKFRNDIKLLYHLAPNGRYELSKVIESKQDYLRAGFTKDQSNLYLKSMSFMNGEVFDATLEDIDINPRTLHHIIGERKSRFPESYADLSEAEITSRLTSALELGVRMNEKDHSYVKPIYYAKLGTVSWLMPFYAEDSFGSDPELVLVLYKNSDFYEVKTILTYDNDIRNRLINLSLYGRLW